MCVFAPTCNVYTLYAIPLYAARLAGLSLRASASAQVGDNLERHGVGHLLVQRQLGGGRADALDRRHADQLAVHDHAWLG